MLPTDAGCWTTVFVDRELTVEGSDFRRDDLHIEPAAG
jgi:hypothetical protein